jgi:hypothetical protein
MGDLDNLEEVAEQMTVRVNERHRRGTIGWAISPNIERAASHCEKRKAAPPDRPPAARPAAPAHQSPQSGEQPVSVIEIRSMLDLVSAFRFCRDERQLTHETIDAIAGFPSGYAGKLLAPEPIKNLGWMSFGLALNVFGKMLLLVDDPKQIRRIKHRWTPRERPARPPAASAQRAAAIDQAGVARNAAPSRGVGGSRDEAEVWGTNRRHRVDKSRSD